MKTAFLPLMGAALLAGCGQGGSARESSATAPGPKRDAAAQSALELSLNRKIAELSGETAELRARVTQLEAENAALRDQAGLEPVATPEPPVVSSAPPPALEPEDAPPEVPVRGTPLTRQQRAQLMRDEIDFRPGRIESSGVPVGEETALAAGQDLQIKWGESWWAGTVTGFEPDGMIRVRYFGWGSYPEEIVPRSDLQLDAGARARAVDATYGPEE